MRHCKINRGEKKSTKNLCFKRRSPLKFARQVAQVLQNRIVQIHSRKRKLMSKFISSLLILFLFVAVFFSGNHSATASTYLSGQYILEIDLQNAPEIQSALSEINFSILSRAGGDYILVQGPGEPAAAMKELRAIHGVLSVEVNHVVRAASLAHQNDSNFCEAAFASL